MFKKLNSALRAVRTLGGKTTVSTVQYGLNKVILDARYGRPNPPTGPFHTLGEVTSINQHERGLTVNSENGVVRLTVIAPDCIQVRFQESGKFPVPFSYAVAKVTWPEISFKMQERDEDITLIAPEIQCVINRSTSALTFKNSRGEIISREAEAITWREGEFRLNRTLPPDEQCFGLACQPTSLDLRGRSYIFWNSDPVNYDRDTIPSYYTIPFYLGVHQNFTCGVFWDNPGRGWVDVGEEQPDRQTFSGVSGELRYYVFSGYDMMSVLHRYTELTGRMPMPPMWALGFHISRWSYYPADRVREIASILRKKKIPCDAIYLDIHYMDGYRCFTWDRDQFPAPALLLTELADQGFKVVAIIDPGIKVDPKYKVYESGLQEEVFLRLPSGKPFVGPVWAGNSVFPDFTSPKARAWWATQCDPLLKSGLAGLWNDMNEPTVFNAGAGNEIPEYIKQDFDGQGATHLEAHNLYGMLMGRASREALEKMRTGKRPFNMIRAAHAGAQRYASTWTGDNRSTWDHLRLNISMVLNSGMSGMAFNGADVGGFAGECEPELYARWIQLGSMMPYFRVHTAQDTPPQEPWAYGQPYENIARSYINLRYQLLPYFYSLFAQSSQNGWPIVRPVFMADPADSNLRKIEDAFMVGDSLLVAPILEKGQTEREVYLPRGRWFDYHTNQPMFGGKTITVKAPLDTLPIFARSGQVIPLWPVQQYVGEVEMTELHLKVYAGNGEVTLYEDAGENMDYLNGAYRWLYFTCKALPTGGFTLDWRRAGKYTPPYEQVRCEVFGILNEPKEVQLDGRSAPLWYYEKGIVEFTANKPFQNAKIIVADASDSPSSTLIHSPFKG
ncbi:MAG: glycoside hydrolase family 31 protein [Chloroflexota bacterium]